MEAPNESVGPALWAEHTGTIHKRIWEPLEGTFGTVRTIGRNCWKELLKRTYWKFQFEAIGFL